MKNYVTIEKWDQPRDPESGVAGDWYQVGPVTVRAADIVEVFTVVAVGMTQVCLGGGGFHKQVITKATHGEVLAAIEDALAEPSAKAKRAA